MTRQVINIGSAANDRTGDPLRTAFTKINDNFQDLYFKDSALSLVARTGQYADLSGRPADFDGTYASLHGKPTIPTDYISVSVLKSIVHSSTDFADFKARIAAL